MLQNIATHVIAGPLGAGKTSLIRQLMAQRPSHERWAVLVNEFGQIGLDAALLSSDQAGIAIAEVAGGCLCCVNGMPFQVGLGRLLRKVRPDRVFIEPSGLGHPLELLKQLGQAPWMGVMNVQPLVMVLDAQALARAEPLPEVQRQALSAAGLLIMNKADSVGEPHRLLITEDLPGIPLFWTNHGEFLFEALLDFSTNASVSTQARNLAVDNDLPLPLALWTNASQPICLAQQGDGGWSIGWRWHPGQRFDRERVQQFLQAWHWRRAKGVIHSDAGWQSFNALRDEAISWLPSEWRTDSRIELIFEDEQAVPDLQQALAACRD